MSARNANRDHGPRTHLLSRAERAQRGKALRARVPRDAFAELHLSAQRDSLAILERQEVRRIDFLVPERRKRMAASSFAYLRGAAAVMAADFAHGPQTGLCVQAAGDSHILNFGTLLSPEGRILFDVNDFDETMPGVDFTVDVRRLAASLAVAAHDVGIERKTVRRLTRAAVEAYRTHLRDLAGLSPYELWMDRVDLADELARLGDKSVKARIRAALDSAERESMHDDDMPQLVNAAGHLRFRDREDRIFHADHPGAAGLVAAAEHAFLAYPATLAPDRRQYVERYRLVDTAIKVVGVGSVGLLCAIGLYATPDKERIVLQLKEAQPSVNAHLAVAPPSEILSADGLRVVAGQRAIQAASDIFLAAVPPGPHGAGPHGEGAGADTAGRHFYVRHLKTTRIASLGDLIARQLEDRDSLAAYGNLCARTLARAHARTGDAAGIGGWLGSSEEFDDAVAAFALSYIAVTDADLEVLRQSIAIDRRAI